MAQCWILLTCSTAGTIALSAVLYRWLEIPGIQAGRSLARILAIRRDVGAQDKMVVPRETRSNPVHSGHLLLDRQL